MQKETAIEWLYETLWKQNDYSLPSNILEQAKEMEKQQIIDAYNEGLYNWDSEQTEEQYYTQIYGGQ